MTQRDDLEFLAYASWEAELLIDKMSSWMVRVLPIQTDPYGTSGECMRLLAEAEAWKERYRKDEP